MSVVIQLIPNQSKQVVNGTVILPSLVFPGVTDLVGGRIVFELVIWRPPALIGGTSVQENVLLPGIEFLSLPREVLLAGKDLYS